MLAGTAAVVKALRPDALVIGVEPAHAQQVRVRKSRASPSPLPRGPVVQVVRQAGQVGRVQGKLQPARVAAQP